MSSFNEEIHDLRERNADLNEEIEFLRVARDNWQARAEDAEHRLESAIAGLRVFQGQLREQAGEMEELRRLLSDSQVLLGHALGVVE